MSESVRNRIRELRAQADDLKARAPFADRNCDMERDLAKARALRREADTLERTLEAANRGGA